MSVILEKAVTYTQQGWSVLPVKADGSKAPAVPWKSYASTPATLDQVINWFASGNYDGLGVVTGAVSGNLEMVELEGRAVEGGAFNDLMTYASDNDLTDLLMRVMSGYMETTPSGGIHIIYTITDGQALRNTKLARNATGEVLAESRGEGGFVVIAPSNGRTHPSGKSWEIDKGCQGTPAQVTADERDRLWALMRLLDKEPVREEYIPQISGALGIQSGLRPGDDYAAATSWSEILTPHGWRVAFPMGGGYAWTRPGKTFGISATTGQSNDGVDRLYVFSTSTAFQAEKPYNKFSAYALLEHGGDYVTAAKTLASQGFGKADTIVVSRNVPTRAPENFSSYADGELVGVVVDVEQVSEIESLAQSEDGHSLAMIAEFGREMRYCHESGRWLHWNGWQWQVQPVGGGVIREYAKFVARHYPEEQGWTSFKRRALSSQGIGGALNMTATDPRILVSIDQ
jgi:putative DNA primase/helicase